MNEKIKKINKAMSILGKKDTLHSADKIEIKDILIDYKRQLISEQLKADELVKDNEENSLSSVAKEMKKASKELRKNF